MFYPAWDLVMNPVQRAFTEDHAVLVNLHLLIGMLLFDVSHPEPGLGWGGWNTNKSLLLLLLLFKASQPCLSSRYSISFTFNPIFLYLKSIYYTVWPNCFLKCTGHTASACDWAWASTHQKEREKTHMSYAWPTGQTYSSLYPGQYLEYFYYAPSVLFPSVIEVLDPLSLPEIKQPSNVILRINMLSAGAGLFYDIAMSGRFSHLQHCPAIL